MKAAGCCLFLLPCFLRCGFATPPEVVVNPAAERQRIDGFGASSAWYADELWEYAEPERDAIVRFLFDSKEGLALNIHRVRINPDPGEHNGDPVYNWADPRLRKEGEFYKRVQDLYDPILLAVPWTPPGWMKTNGSQRDGGSLKPRHYQDYANYLAGWIAGMEREFGLTVDILSIQNEPDGAKKWESCIWTAAEFSSFISNYLQPELKRRGIEVPLMLSEDTKWRDDLIDAVLDDPTSGAMIDYAAAHLYHGSYRSPKTFKNAADRGLPVWMTEYYYGDYNIAADFPEQTAATFSSIERTVMLGRIMQDHLVRSEVNAYLFWWLLAQPHQNEESLLQAAASFKDQTLPRTGWNPNKWAWGMMQFSRFIRPGDVRVEISPSITGENDAVRLSAYRSEGGGRLTVVAVNQSGQRTDFVLNLLDSNATELLAFRTSESENCGELPAVAARAGGRFQISLQPASITTFIAATNEAAAKEH